MLIVSGRVLFYLKMNISFFYLTMTVSNLTLIPFSVSNLTLFSQGPQWYGKTFQRSCLFFYLFFTNVMVTMLHSLLFSVFFMSTFFFYDVSFYLDKPTWPCWCIRIQLMQVWQRQRLRTGWEVPLQLEMAWYWTV